MSVVGHVALSCYLQYYVYTLPLRPYSAKHLPAEPGTIITPYYIYINVKVLFSRGGYLRYTTHAQSGWKVIVRLHNQDQANKLKNLQAVFTITIVIIFTLAKVKYMCVETVRPVALVQPGLVHFQL